MTDRELRRLQKILRAEAGPEEAEPPQPEPVSAVQDVELWTLDVIRNVALGRAPGFPLAFARGGRGIVGALCLPMTVDWEPPAEHRAATWEISVRPEHAHVDTLHWLSDVGRGDLAVIGTAATLDYALRYPPLRGKVAAHPQRHALVGILLPISHVRRCEVSASAEGACMTISAPLSGDLVRFLVHSGDGKIVEVPL